MSMRVVHVSHTASRGGAELALARLLQADHPWQATVCAPAGGDAFTGLGPRAELDLTLPAFPTGGTRGRSPLLAARYLAALRSNARALSATRSYQRADLIHANTALAGIVAALGASRGSAPLIVHLRDLITPESLGRVGYEIFTRVALKRCNGVIANSGATLESAAAQLTAGVPRIVIQSPSGVTTRATVPAVRPEVGAVGMIGRLQRWKGQHIFIQAFARAFAGTTVRAYIAGAPIFGEEEYESELRQLAGALGVGDRVEFLGHVDDIPDFLEKVDVLVHASTRPEPLGQSVIQGLAAAKPVIATEGGGPSELISHGEDGLLVTPGSVEAMAAALLRLAGHPGLRAHLAAGAVRHPGLLTDAECAQAHADFFRAVSARGGQPNAEGRTP